MSEEQLNSDAGLESSSDSQSTAVEGASESSGATEASNTSGAREVPFHEHPRFKELINEKNDFAKKYEEMSSQFKAMRSQMEEMSKPKTVETKNALIERIKTVDPEFGTWAEKQEAAKTQLEELTKWRNEIAQQQVRTQAVNMVEKLHADNKVPKELQDRYNRELRAIAAENPNLQVEDLPKVYAQVHKEWTSFLDARDRAKLASYTSGKKPDSALPPSASKGPAPKQGGKTPAYSADKEEARGQLIKQVMNNLRANSDN